jgi:hypothetical protein
MTSNHTNTYTALICKCTQFQNHRKKTQDMGLSDLHDKEFKIFALEYNTSSTEPNNELDHYVNTLQHSNEDYNPGRNDMFLNNPDPTLHK